MTGAIRDAVKVAMAKTIEPLAWGADHEGLKREALDRADAALAAIAKAGFILVGPPLSERIDELAGEILRSLNGPPHERNFVAEAINRAIARTSRGMGFAIVPVVPTEAMLEAGANRWDTHDPGAGINYANERATWAAMIAAGGVG